MDTCRRQPQARQGRRERTGTPHRPRTVRAANLGRNPHSRHKSCGCCRSISGFRPIPTSYASVPLLFLSRRGADAGHVQGTDHRLGPGDEVAVRPPRRLRDSCCWHCPSWVSSRSRSSSTAPARRCTARSGFHYNERIDVYQVALDVIHPGRSDRRQNGDQERPPHHPRRARGDADQPRRTAAALQRRVQEQPLARRCPASPRSARQLQSRLYDEAVDGYFARHRGQPGDNRLGANQRLARRNRHRRKSEARRSISTTARTGPCCSTSTYCSTPCCQVRTRIEASPSLRAQRSNPSRNARKDG